jgi:hypothetical protein
MNLPTSLARPLLLMYMVAVAFKVALMFEAMSRIAANSEQIYRFGPKGFQLLRDRQCSKRLCLSFLCIVSLVLAENRARDMPQAGPQTLSERVVRSCPRDYVLHLKVEVYAEVARGVIFTWSEVIATCYVNDRLAPSKRVACFVVHRWSRVREISDAYLGFIDELEDAIINVVVVLDAINSQRVNLQLL